MEVMVEKKDLPSTDEIYQHFLEMIYLEEKNVIIKELKKTKSGCIDIYVVALVRKHVINICTGYYHIDLHKILDVNKIHLNFYDIKDIQEAIQKNKFIE